MHDARRDPAAVTGPDGRIYVFGGANSQFLGLEVYDPLTNKWTSLPPLPQPLYGPGGGRSYNQVVAIAGMDNSGNWTSQTYRLSTG